MNPIFTIENKHNINGYRYDTFIEHFDSICQEHLETGRAKKFAFIVYDFHSPTHEVLQNNGVFTELDRLSGKNITIFYLDGQLNRKRNNQNKLYNNFNRILIELAGQNIHNIPFIVFFDFKDGDVVKFRCYEIRNNENFILNDLSFSITKELNKVTTEKTKKKASFLSSIFKKTINDTPKILYTEFIKFLLKGIYETNKN